MPDRLAEIHARLNAWHKDPQATALDLYFSPADIAWLLTELSARDSDVEDIYDLRDQVNALWDVIHAQGAGDTGRWTALYEERLEVQRDTRRPHASSASSALAGRLSN
jgi:hypothetical protein